MTPVARVSAGPPRTLDVIERRVTERSASLVANRRDGEWGRRGLTTVGQGQRLGAHPQQDALDPSTNATLTIWLPWDPLVEPSQTGFNGILAPRDIFV